MRAILTNVSVPMPLRRKLYLVFRNNLIKIRQRQSCCGHPGEPGCWRSLEEQVPWGPGRRRGWEKWKL